MKRLLLVIILIPQLALAGFGDQVNSLLKSFFAPHNAEEVEEQKKIEFTTPELDIPEVEVPENPTTKDLQDFRKKVQLEEEALDNFDKEISESQSRLWDLETKKRSFTKELRLLDQELSLVTEKLTKLEEQEAKWQKDLEVITKEKSNLKALIRVKDEELEEFLQKNYLQEENFGLSGADQKKGVLKWLFSSKSIGKILQEQELNKKFVQIKSGKLAELEQLKSRLETKEQHASFLFNEVSILKQRIITEKKYISDMAEAKARLIARLEFSQGKIEKEMENFYRQKLESTVLLQNLRLALEEVQEKVGTEEVVVEAEEEESILSFPLKIPLRVTAHFRSPEYVQEFGQEHFGTDFFAPQGTPIYAPRDGIVKKIGNNGYNYSYFIVDHGDDLFTVYGHVSEIFVNEGQVVQKGEQIALSGGTPGMRGSGFLTSGPHLHLEVFYQGQHVDPLSMINN
ncbi:peptidoglycan DD-metalloendopeptidase family protein [Candidatus Gracilibacteria bacterium]|nr:peptidoglycan DD-metalloendopeptidase family protein [Candidatus Gracilibacteria bacterium]